jgi:hypothetical protein
MEHNRMAIYAKDVERILGKSERAARTILNLIKKKLGKERHQPVSLLEFCSYMGMNPEEVSKYL